MIGDWVLLKDCDGACDIITGITGRGVLLDSNSDGSFEDIEPIPLTAEILEKNGWKKEIDKEEYRVKYMLGEQGKNCWMMWSVKYRIIDIQRQDENLDMYNLCITKVCIPCEYVHQLQQALRLSELPELADNFKV